MASPFTMSIEEHEYEAFTYGFHLGTDEAIARDIVGERFRARACAGMPTITIALMRDGEYCRCV